MENRDIKRWAIEFEIDERGREIGTLVAYTDKDERITFQHEVYLNGEFHHVDTTLIAEDPKNTP